MRPPAGRGAAMAPAPPRAPPRAMLGVYGVVRPVVGWAVALVCGLVSAVVRWATALVHGLLSAAIHWVAAPAAAALVLMIRVRGLVSGPIPGVAALVPVARVLAALVLGRPVPPDLRPRICVARAT